VIFSIWELEQKFEFISTENSPEPNLKWEKLPQNGSYHMLIDNGTLNATYNSNQKTKTK